MEHRSIPNPSTQDTLLLRVRVTRAEYRTIRRIAAEEDKNMGEIMRDAVELYLRYQRSQGIPAGSGLEATSLSNREEACDD